MYVVKFNEWINFLADSSDALLISNKVNCISSGEKWGAIKVIKGALQAKFNYVDEEPTNLDNLEFLPEEKETVSNQVNNPYFKDYLKDELGE